LRLAGHQTTVADNGKVALAFIARHTFDVVLMDIQMPEMDGFCTTAAIRAQEQQTGRHLLIIALTAHALKGDRERCMAAGMDGYISKPMSSEDLLAVLPTAQPALAAEGAFDLAATLQGIDGDLELLHELAVLFDGDAPEQVALIRDAVDRQDAAKLERAAQRLKGSLVPFAAASAMKAVEALETMGRTHDLSHASDEYRFLDAEMQRLLAALKDLTSLSPDCDAGRVATTGFDSCPDPPCEMRTAT
jgi:two-component system, sensor histidine kinase and response regulator